MCICHQVLHNASQEEVYEECARGVVSRLLDGYNGTVMAYGETGAGKTYTMTGGMQTYRLRGVIPRAIAQVGGALYRGGVTGIPPPSKSFPQEFWNF